MPSQLWPYRASSPTPACATHNDGRVCKVSEAKGKPMLTSKKSANTVQPSRSYLRHSALTLIGCSFLLLASPVTQADVWAYTDGNGKTHYADERVAPQYQLFFKDAGNGEKTRSMLGLAEGKAASVRQRPAATPAGRLGRNLQAITVFNESKRYDEWRKIVNLAAKVHQVDAELLQAVIAVESGFDHRAISPRGAVGLMQLMPITAEHFGVADRQDPKLQEKLVDPKTNVMLGAQFLSHLQKTYPDRLDLVVAAYNAGEGNVRAAGGQVPRFVETQNYVRRVLGLYASIKPDANIPDLNDFGKKSRIIAMN